MKKKIEALLIMVLAAGLAAGCGGGGESKASVDDSYYSEGAYETYEGSSYDDVAEYSSDASNGSEASSEVTESSAVTDRKLIRTVTIDVETYDFDELNSQIESKVSELGGYIESSSVDGGSDSYSGTRDANYTLRIPKDKADELIAKVETSGNVTHRSEDQEDVTLDYVDIQSRKESLEVEYDRLQELLAEAADVDVMVQLEERMAEVRYEIQSIESQLRTYDNKVDYTTIYLYVTEVKQYTEAAEDPQEMPVGQRIAKGLSASIANIVVFLKNLLVYTVVAIPYLILIAIPVVIVLLIVKACRKRSARKAKAGQPGNLVRPYTDMVQEAAKRGPSPAQGATPGQTAAPAQGATPGQTAAPAQGATPGQTAAPAPGVTPAHGTMPGQAQAPAAPAETVQKK